MSTAGRTPSALPLDAELQRLLKRMRLPYIRSVAPELLATAKTQRWDPAEVLKALLAEEVSGRDRSALATRRARAGFPTGKTFAAWDPARFGNGDRSIGSSRHERGGRPRDDELLAGPHP